MVDGFAETPRGDLLDGSHCTSPSVLPASPDAQTPYRSVLETFQVDSDSVVDSYQSVHEKYSPASRIHTFASTISESFAS